MGRPLRLLQILWPGLGGHGQELQAFLKWQPEFNYTQAVIFFGNVPVTAELEAACESSGVSYSWVENRPRRRFKTIWSLVKAIARFQADFVLCRTGETCAIASLMKPFNGAKAIYIETNAGGAKTRREMWCSKLAMILADQIICISAPQYDELARACGAWFAPNKVTVIPNGVDTDFYAPDHHRPKSKEIRLGMHGRIVQDKDHETLIRAINLLREKDYFSHLRLILPGVGDLLPQLKELVQQFQLETHVSFPGYLNRTQTREFLQSLDLFVQATLAESFCFSVLEACSVGLPVISARVAILDVLLQDLDFVRFYPAGNSASLAIQLDKCLTSEPFLNSAGMRARAFVIENFGQKAMVCRYIEHLTELGCVRA